MLISLSLFCRATEQHACPLGLEGSGIVRRSASAIHAVGARVFFGHLGSARGRLLKLKDSQAGAVPPHWSLQSAAGLSVVFDTGIMGLRKCGLLNSRSAALVVGGGTATGNAMLQMLRANKRFDRIVASCGNATACRAAGATDVIDRKAETLEAGLKRLKLRSLSLVYETTIDESAWPLAQEYGAECFLAIDAGVDFDAPLPGLLAGAARLIWRAVSRSVRRWIWGGPAYFTYNAEHSPEDVYELARLMRTDAIVPPHIVEFPFTTQGVREALQRLHDQRPGGKIVLKLPKKA